MLRGSLLSVKRSLTTREPTLPTKAERPSSTLRRSSAVARYHSRLAVAAASILARDEFVKRLAALGKDYGVELPKGAGTNVDGVAKELFARNGVEALTKIAKMHFRTALRAQGLPEPPKTEWRRGG